MITCSPTVNSPPRHVPRFSSHGRENRDLDRRSTESKLHSQEVNLNPLWSLCKAFSATLRPDSKKPGKFLGE